MRKLLEALKKDLAIRVVFKYDHTFWMHFLRDLIIYLALSHLNFRFAAGMTLGINLAWEWQDGLHNDGFNVIDFLAGLFGLVLGVVLRT